MVKISSIVSTILGVNVLYALAGSPYLETPETRTLSAVPTATVHPALDPRTPKKKHKHSSDKKHKHTDEKGATQTTSVSVPKVSPVTRSGQPGGAKIVIDAGSSAVHVGTLTGEPLFTSVSNALETLCPTPQSGVDTGCQTTSIRAAKDIIFLEGDDLHKNGELMVQVEIGRYNSSSMREMLISQAALTAQKATEHNGSCINATYEKFIQARPAVLLRENQTFCNTGGFTSVEYYPPDWRTAEDPIPEGKLDVLLTFKVKPLSPFLCFFLEILEDAMDAFMPEDIPGLAAGEAMLDLSCSGG